MTTAPQRRYQITLVEHIPDGSTKERFHGDCEAYTFAVTTTIRGELRVFPNHDGPIQQRRTALQPLTAYIKTTIGIGRGANALRPRRTERGTPCSRCRPARSPRRPLEAIGRASARKLTIARSLLRCDVSARAPALSGLIGGVREGADIGVPGRPVNVSDLAVQCRG